tara:strand:+ start:70 stop:801 length:732 start_codon:yes stop_codon:yes gene_type:complete
MGIKIFDIEDVFSYVENHFHCNLNTLNLIELGEQEFKILKTELNNELVKDYIKTNPRKWPNKCNKNRIGLYSKDYFSNFFYEVVCIDIAYTCKKTLNLNLCDDLNHRETYNVLTNFGTTEHVGEIDNVLKNVQYSAFKNLHALVKKNGIVFNVVPAQVTKNVVHGAFNYTCEFFEKLAKLCQYKIVYNEVKKRGDIYHVYCYFIKTEENEFITEKQFMSLKPYLFTTKNVQTNPKKYFDEYIE